MVIASLNSARAKARDARRIAEVSELHKALAMYYVDTGTYPGNTSFHSASTAGCTFSGAVDWNTVLDVNFRSSYLNQLPTEVDGKCLGYSRHFSSGAFCSGIPINQYEYVIYFETENDQGAKFPKFGNFNCSFGPLRG